MKLPEFTFSRDYSISSDSSTLFVQNIITGGKVEIDDLGRLILQALPGNSSQVQEKLNGEGLIVSPLLIDKYLQIFNGANIIKEVVKNRDKTRSTKKDRYPSYDVVIVTHNGQDFIKKCLQSVFSQTIRPAEVIVIDNASNDRTTEILAEFPNVELIPNKKNLHYARAVNLGVAVTARELVLVLNQDTVLETDFSQKLLEAYSSEREKEKIAAIVPQIRFQHLPGFVNGIGNVISSRGWGSDNYFGVADIGQFSDLREVGSACFGAVMIKRFAWEKLQGLDRTFVSFYEDIDWSFRAHLEGFTLLAAPGAIVFHHFGGSYPMEVKLPLVIKNRLRFAFRNLKGRRLAGTVRNYTREDLGNCIQYLKQGRFNLLTKYFKAYLKLLLELPGITLYRIRSFTMSKKRMDSFFKLMEPQVTIANPDHWPIISKDVIRSYYYLLPKDK